jgi:hypothetical protein
MSTYTSGVIVREYRSDHDQFVTRE